MDIASARAAHEDRILAAPGVIGVGVGDEDGEEVIVVFVEALTPDTASPERLGLPARLESYRLVVREIGTITAGWLESDETTKPRRPRRTHKEKP